MQVADIDEGSDVVGGVEADGLVGIAGVGASELNRTVGISIEFVVLHTGEAQNLYTKHDIHSHIDTWLGSHTHRWTTEVALENLCVQYKGHLAKGPVLIPTLVVLPCT